MADKKKSKVNVRDLKPSKDAKGGSGGLHAQAGGPSRAQSTGPSRAQSTGPSRTSLH